MDNLTEKQRRVLDFIEKYLGKYGRSPTYQEIQQNFELKAKSTVHDYVSALKVKGYLHQKGRQWNGLQLVQTSNTIPLLGKVAAGRPIQYLKFGEALQVPDDMLKGRGQFFALQVLGDSMIEEGILEDDYVVVRKQDHADNGQIVVAHIDNEATIKYFYKRKSHVELHSANEKYKPIHIKEHQHFRIEGVFRGLIRKGF